MKILEKEIKTKMIKVIIFIMFIVFCIIQLEKFNTWVFVEGPVEVKMLFLNFGIFLIPVFILLYVIANIFLTPFYLFIFLSGIIFGPVGGVIISLIAEIISATVNFFIGRKIKRRYVLNIFNHKKILFIKKYIDEHGFRVILATRYLGLYFDVVSYAAGLTKIKYNEYIVATVIGYIPYIFIYVYAGCKIVELQSSDFIYIVVIGKVLIYSSFLFGYLMYRASRKK